MSGVNRMRIEKLAAAYGASDLGQPPLAASRAAIPRRRYASFSKISPRAAACGHRRLQILRWREGWAINHKRVA